MSTPADSARPHAAAELAVDPAATRDVGDLHDAVGSGADLPLEADPADVVEPDPVEAVRARFELPLEADPADVAEQDAAVPFDDDLYGDDER
jgi:hypothetical protein